MYEAAGATTLGKHQVGIAISNGLLGTHLGIAYVDHHGVGQILHLAFHEILILEPMPHDASWAISIIDMEADLADVTIGLILSIAQKYSGWGQGGLPYGINLFGAVSAFKQGSHCLLGPGADGLTCASFVEAVFEGVDLPLVDVGTWQTNTKNKVWGDAIVCMLKCTKALPAHIAAVQSNISGLRLLPEEVAAGAEKFDPNSPVSQKQAQRRAAPIVKEMRLICGPQTQAPNPCLCTCVQSFELGTAAHAGIKKKVIDWMRACAGAIRRFFASLRGRNDAA